MKIIIAPDSFKESLSALEAAEAIERGRSFRVLITENCRWRMAAREPFNLWSMRPMEGS
ncbi:glycerate kinase [Bacillus subtilis]|nr:glycerate kinase [Bacillus subtilis]